MHYEKKKRKEYDFCNICGEERKLTWDHVPPKCCNNRYNIKVNSWGKGLPKETSYEKAYQNGIRFRSLCEDCNNKLLGANYDVTLAEFTNQVMHIVSSDIVLPSICKIPVKINELSRAICGHLLAAKNYYDDASVLEKQLREYVQNSGLCPPQDMSLLYWVYPYSTIFLLRDVSVKSYSTKYAFPEGMVSIMNSFPIAYMLSSGSKEDCGLFDIFKFCSSTIDEVVEIPIDRTSCYFPRTKHLRPSPWPCNVSDEEDGAMFLLGSSEEMKDSKIAKQSIENVKKIRESVKTYKVE